MERREALKLSAGFLGYSLSGIVFSGMLNGCKVDNSEDWRPRFFTKEQANSIAEIAEHILPKTDTPGAKDVLVDRFMDKLIADCYEAEEQKKFLAGLTTFQKACKKLTGNTFEDCNHEQRDRFLTTQEEIPYRPAMYLWGNQIKKEGEVSFYHQIKGLTLFGYFSSEEVGENVLNYDPVPGKFIGCLPLSEIGNSWSI
jgi:hypothetical protein